MIDLDKQGNLSKFYLGVSNFENMPKGATVAALFDQELDPELTDIIHRPEGHDVCLVPATRQLKHHLYVDKPTFDATKFELRDFISELADAFDVILMDTPPDIDSLSTIAALLASDFVITPVQAEVFSAQGVRGGELVIQEAIQENSRLRFLGYIINQLDKRRAIHKAFEKQLRQYHNDQVFETVITNLGAFPEAEALHQAVTQADAKSKAAQLARSFVAEMLDRMNKVNLKPTPTAKTGRAAA